jgi:hypothetical protein
MGSSVNTLSFSVTDQKGNFLFQMTGVADVVYVNNVTCTLGCGRAGGLVKGGADQRQGWMGIRHHEQTG